MRRCFYHTDLRQLAVSFTIFQDKLHSFNIQDNRSTRGLLAKQFKKFPKSPTRPAGYLQRIFKRVMLQHNKEFIVFILY